MAPKYIKRVTVFKIAKEEDIATTLRQYETLRDTAVKVRDALFEDDGHLNTLAGREAIHIVE